MKNIFILVFLVYTNIMAGRNELTLKYKYNEPLLGKGHYLIVSDIPVPTYPNTVGYFSNVEILGKNLQISKDLEKVTIKKDGKIIREEKVDWNNYIFQMENIDLDGLVVDLKWKSLNRQKIELALSEWNLEEKNYRLEIEYTYPSGNEIMLLNIEMPEFNPDIYLDFDYRTPILKKQEYEKKYLIVKKIVLSDYDLEITKSNDKLDGLRLILSPNAIIEGDNSENNHYKNDVKIVPLIEKYPGIFIEELNYGDVFKNSKEIYIGVELPKDIRYNSNYKISGNILSAVYKNKKKPLIDKIIILNGEREIFKTVGIRKNHSTQDRIYVESLEKNGNYYEIESSDIIDRNYKNMKIKLGNIVEVIDNLGNSKIITLENMKLKVEKGEVFVLIDDLTKVAQGTEISYKIIDKNGDIIDKINLKFYVEN